MCDLSFYISLSYKTIGLLILCSSYHSDANKLYKCSHVSIATWKSAHSPTKARIRIVNRRIRKRTHFQMCHTANFGIITLSPIRVQLILLVATNVTRLGDLLHFGKLFKACLNNYFAQIAQIFRQFL